MCIPDHALWRNHACSAGRVTTACRAHLQTCHSVGASSSCSSAVRPSCFPLAQDSCCSLAAGKPLISQASTPADDAQEWSQAVNAASFLHAIHLGNGFNWTPLEAESLNMPLLQLVGWCVTKKIRSRIQNTWRRLCRDGQGLHHLLQHNMSAGCEVRISLPLGPEPQPLAQPLPGRRGQPNMLCIAQEYPSALSRRSLLIHRV